MVQARSVTDLVRGCRAEGGGAGRGRDLVVVGSLWRGAAGWREEWVWVVRVRSDSDLVRGRLVVGEEGRRLGLVVWASWGGAAGWRRERWWVVQVRSGCVDLVRDHHVESDGEGRRGGGRVRPETVGVLLLGLDRWWWLGLGVCFRLNCTFCFLFVIFVCRSSVWIHLSDPK